VARRGPSGLDAMLTAHAVPAHLFDAYHWLLPVGVPHPSRWHYGWPRATPHRGSLSVNPATVDPALRPLVLTLHRRGIRTLPSCEGHFSRPTPKGRPDPALLLRSRDLRAQAPLIRGPGLLMQDVESGALWRVVDPAYKLPSFPEMVENHAAQEGSGYIGIMIPYRIQLRWSPYIQTQANAERLDIRVKAPNAATQHRVWARITADILDQT
jgi:hypothetical protein